MTRSNVLFVDGRIYHRNPDVDRFQIPLSELGSLRMVDIPANSHLELLGIPFPTEEYECELWIVNGGKANTDEFLSVYGGASKKVTEQSAPYELARLKKAFPDIYPLGHRQNPELSVENFMERGLTAHAFMSLNFEGKGVTPVSEAVAPFLSAFRRLSMPVIPDVRVFICHASEDKPTARQIAQFLKGMGSAVWFDEWEIRVGESIVQRIDSALSEVTHLLLLLSQNSVDKAWVKKEFSSALMRQLSDNSISILPLRLDNGPVPAILADIKYADARVKMEQALYEIEHALFPSTVA